MDRHPKPLASGFFLAVLLSFAPHVSAQGSEAADPVALEEARRIFAEGLEHSDRREWHQAVSSFRQVMEIRAAPPVLYNLAVALVEIGEYPEAGDRLAQVLADDTTTDANRGQATTLRAGLETRGGTVSVVFRGDSSGLVFFIDDYPLAPAAAAEPHFLAPGSHAVSVRRGSAVLARREVEATAGRGLAIELAPPEAAPLGPEVVAAPPPAPEPSERPLVKNPWLWTGVGVGTALVITVIVVTATRGGDTRTPFTGNFTPGRITW
jgi:hypothetical protein